MASPQAHPRYHEARKTFDQAKKKITTSLFRWTPDFVIAEPMFQRAATDFQSIGARKEALDAFKFAAECCNQNGSFFSAGKHLEKAAQMALELSDQDKDGSEGDEWHDKARDFLDRAVLEFQRGDQPVRAADILLKLAQMAQDDDEEAALQHMQSAMDVLEEAGKERFGIDKFSKTLGFLAERGRYTQAVELAGRMATVYQRLGQPRNVHKMFLTVTIMHLAANDPPAADAAFQEHLQDDEFLRSKECEAEEEMLTACKEFDQGRLDAQKASAPVGYLLPQVGRVAQRLSVDSPVPPLATGSGPSMQALGSGQQRATQRPARPARAAASGAASAGKAAASTADTGLSSKQQRNALFGAPAAAAPAPAAPARKAPAPAPAPASASASEPAPAPAPDAAPAAASSSGAAEQGGGEEEEEEDLC